MEDAPPTPEPPPQRFARQVGESLAARAALMVIGVGTSAVLARALGPAGHGAYAAAVTFGGLGVHAVSLGLPGANNYAAARDPKHLPALLANSGAVTLALGGGAALALAAVATTAPALLPVSGALAAVALGWIPVGLAHALLLGLLLGRQRVRAHYGIELAMRGGLWVAFAALWVGGARGVATFAAAALAALAGAATAAWWALGGPVRTGRPSLALLRDHARYGAKSWGINLLGFAVLRVDLLLMYRWRPGPETGWYAAAAQAAENIYLVPGVVGSLLLARLAAIPDPAHRARQAGRAIRAAAWMMLALTVAAAAAAPILIPLIFGSEFSPSVPLLWCLLPGIACLGVQAVAAQYLASAGLPRGLVGVWAAGCALNLAANAWAIPAHGGVGAAWVSSATYALVCVGTLWLVVGLRRAPSGPAAASRA